jgi:toxin CcdB
MAQFDVHANTGPNRSAIPFVVVVQSKQFDAMRTRLVAALRAAPAGNVADPTITPLFRIAGKRVILDPFQIVPVPRGSLGQVIASLADNASSNAIINAIDAVITRACG